MNIEQLPPKKPNFGKVVALAAAALLAIFVVAYFILAKTRSAPRPYNKAPTSQLHLVGPNSQLSC